MTASVTLRLQLNSKDIRTCPYSHALRKEWVGAGRAKPSRPEVYMGVIEGDTRCSGKGVYKKAAYVLI